MVVDKGYLLFWVRESIETKKDDKKFNICWCDRLLVNYVDVTDY